MERLWPALEDIDTSTGALGGAIHRTLDELIPILISAGPDFDPNTVDEAKIRKALSSFLRRSQRKLRTARGS
jgi:hypothetical protein